MIRKGKVEPESREIYKEVGSVGQRQLVQKAEKKLRTKFSKVDNLSMLTFLKVF